MSGSCTQLSKLVNPFLEVVKHAGKGRSGRGRGEGVDLELERKRDEGRLLAAYFGEVDLFSRGKTTRRWR